MEACDAAADARAHCTFCHELICPPERSRYFRVLEGRPERKVLKRTEHFVVIPGIGQLVPGGYVLIRPVDHYISCGHMPASLFPELEALKEEIRRVLGRVYDAPTVFFEHGALTEAMRGACCTDHAHVHVMPLRLDITDEVVRILNAERISGLLDLRDKIAAQVPYVSLENAVGDVYASDARGTPKQVIRRIIARRLGLGEAWDWKAGVDEQGFIIERAVRETVDRLEAWTSVA